MKNAIQAIKHARKIATECNERANQIEADIKCMEKKHYRKKRPSISEKCYLLNTRYDMQRKAEKLRIRAQKVWSAAIDYQGRYINWKDVHVIDGKTYCGVVELINASFD